jgi:hypothetical protein
LIFFGSFHDFFLDIWDFITVGIYDFFVDWFGAFFLWMTVEAIRFKVWSLGFAWDVAQSVMVQLDVSSVLAAAWAKLDSKLLNFLTFLNIPDAINLIFSARITRMVLNFMGL